VVKTYHTMKILTAVKYLEREMKKTGILTKTDVIRIMQSYAYYYNAVKNSKPKSTVLSVHTGKHVSKSKIK